MPLTLAALAVSLGVLVFGAIPASAILYRLPNGKVLSYEHMKGQPLAGGNSPEFTQPPSSATNSSNFDSIFQNLDYSGGPVMPSNTNRVIAWIPQGYTGNPFQDVGYDTHLSCPSGDNCGYMYGVAQYFQDLQVDSNYYKTHNPHMVCDNNNVLSNQGCSSDTVAVQYNDAHGQVAAYNSSYAGGGTGPNNVWIDTDPIPGGGSGCTAHATTANGGDAKGSGGFCITDAQIQTELNHFLTVHSLPRGMTNEYFLLTPPDVVSCMSASSCSGNSSSNPRFCGYHTQSTGSSPFIYANIPDAAGTTTNSLPDGVLGCDPFVTNAECGPNGFDFCDYNTFADGVLSATSHEHNESTTDPHPNNAWTNWAANATPETAGENGDLCNNDAGSSDDPSTTYVEQSNFHYYPYNEKIGNHTYWIQLEWSNQYRSCQNSWLPTAHPTSNFTVAGQNGMTRTFHATPCSSCTYVWQFNDDVVPGDTPQQNTVATTNPTISHHFPKYRTYSVALTTQAADGRSWGASKSVKVADVTPPVIGAATIPAGQTVRSIIASGFKISSHLSEAGTEKGTLLITAAKAQQLGIPRTIGTGTLAFPTAGTRTMIMHLTATAKNKLKNQSNLAITATLNATDKAGNHAHPVSKSTTLPH